MRDFMLWKMSNLLNFIFWEEWYSLKCDNIELKRSSKIDFSVAEDQLTD